MFKSATENMIIVFMFCRLYVNFINYALIHPEKKRSQI